MVGLLRLIGFYNRRAEIVSNHHIYLQGSSWNFIANLANLSCATSLPALFRRLHRWRGETQQYQCIRFFWEGAGLRVLGQRRIPPAVTSKF